MVIYRNLHAISLGRIQKFRNWDIKKNTEKVASGLRINTAGNDAAGLAVTEKMRGQIRGLRQAERNAEDGISMVQTAEGYLEETSDILQRIRTLAVQSANGTYTDEDRELIQSEVSQLIDEVDRVASQARFNKKSLLRGAFARTGRNPVMTLHVGPNKDQKEAVYIEDMSAAGLDIKTRSGVITVNLRDMDNANRAIGQIDSAIYKLNKQRADLGSYYTRLEEAAMGLLNTNANVQMASSLFRDADVAEEMVKLTKDQILASHGNSVLIQTMHSPGMVMRILKS